MKLKNAKSANTSSLDNYGKLDCVKQGLPLFNRHDEKSRLLSFNRLLTGERRKSSVTDPAAGQVAEGGGGTRNMKSIRPPSAAIFL